MQTIRPSSTSTSEFRRDIEGLRGVAVLAVVLFHLNLRLAAGGFTGVDIFFVVSGYLITGILIRQASRDKYIDFSQFWARRVRRILPAATTVLLASACLILLTLTSPFDLYRQAGDIGAAAIFIINWRLAAQTIDYLSPHDLPSVVQHYWSLAIEEQFYAFWPFVMFSAFAVHLRYQRVTFRAAVVIASIILWIASFGLSLYLAKISAPYAFFSSASRAWQLLTGACIASVTAGSSRPLSTRTSNLLGLAGLTAIAVGFGALSTITSYPGWLALLPTLGSGAVILAGINYGAGVTTAILSLPFLRFMGRISYSWYLWHWPIFWTGQRFGLLETLEQKIVFLSISFLIGSASYFFIENPARYYRPLTKSRLGSLATGACLIVASICSALTVRHLQILTNVKATLHDGRVIPLQPQFARIVEDGCQLTTGSTIQPPCVYGDAESKFTVVLFGDSHAAHYFPGLSVAARSAGWRLVVRTMNGCPPTNVEVWSSSLKRSVFECAVWRSKVYQLIAKLRPQAVIIGSSSDYVLPRADGTGPASATETAIKFQDGTRRLVRRLLQSTTNVTLMRDTPVLPEWPMTCLLRNPKNEQKCSWSVTTILPARRFPYGISTLSPRVKLLDMTATLCPHGTCATVWHGALLMNDRSHLSAPAARILAPQFEALLNSFEPAAHP